MTAECFQIWDIPVQALPGGQAQFDFGDVQPTAMNLQPIKQPPCFGGRKSFVQGSRGVGVQLVSNQHRLVGIDVIHIEQRLALLGQIGRCFSGAHTDLATAAQGFSKLTTIPTCSYS